MRDREGESFYGSLPLMDRNEHGTDLMIDRWEVSP